MSTTSRRTRRRRWGIALLSLLAAWITAIQSGCLSMRTSDAKWASKLREAGQSLPLHFAKVPAPAIGRTVHAAHLEQPDSLPVVLLIHGSPGSTDAYLSFFADTALTRQARLLTYDRPGFGYTSGFGKAEGSLSNQAKAALAVLDHFAPGKKAVVFGHSMGGPVAVRFAMDYPERTAAIMLAAASVSPDLEAQPWWQTVVDNPPASWLIPKSMVTSNREIMPLKEELQAIMPQWEAIRSPAAILHAENDRLVPFGNAAFARQMLVNSPEIKEYLLAEGDHFFIWSQPQLMRESILTMIAAASATE